MSHPDSELDELFRSAREEPIPHRWQEQREVFRRLRLGGSGALLVARLAHAFTPLPLSKSLGAAVGLTLAVSVAAVGAHLASEKRASSSAGSEGSSRAVAVPTLASSVIIAPAPTPAVEATTSTASVSVDALPSAVAKPSGSVGVHRHAPLAASQARLATRAPADEPRAGEDSLERELASVSKIRAQVAARDYIGARSATVVHRASFPQGVLAQEVEVLEIEALRGLRDPRACVVGKAFLDAHPTSAHRDRVLGLTSACNP